MYNVVISFHSSMSATDWRGRQLRTIFPEPGVKTFFIDGGSTFGCSKTTSATANCPNGKDTTYTWLVERFATVVPRSPSDPKYVANNPATHTRKAVLAPYVEHYLPQLKGQQYRVCIIGFSEGCGGVGSFLKQADIGYIDTVVAIDGIHWGKENICPENSDCMRLSSRPWLTFASLAAFGKPPDNTTIRPGSRCMVITNSDTPGPPCCRKTKYSSEYIARTIFAGMGPDVRRDLPPGVWPLKHEPPVHIGGSHPVDYYESHGEWFRAWNNLWILSYSNIDVQGSGRADHIYQSKVVLPLVLEKIVVPRWTASTGATTVGV